MSKINLLDKWLVLIVISTHFAVGQLQAEPFSLKSLTPEYGEVNNNLATITMIFQPNCSWCKKQGQVLAKAFTQCQSSLNVALVGAKGNFRALKNALKHYHKGIPAYAANRQFLRKIGGYQASPTTLIFSGEGQLIAKKRGFIPKDKLSHALAVLSHGACQIK
ncbi:hypothetical protein tinsulaeT_03290 [Thalassotalea insulae]|uniref:Thioredoxin domain-containing protein n=1 Tax=Thalassotalea insulae TaxID=2056778 RepID=A0ABQ6GPB2_9GAMM|nr:hypothetical protein [Thalassotalea insulae]GLX76989.1 hypothetical protein tinsulaeT_03290 [Thalassotalea insulae]